MGFGPAGDGKAVYGGGVVFEGKVTLLDSEKMQEWLGKYGAVVAKEI